MWHSKNDCCWYTQIVESTGTVMKPYMDFPQLLSLLLRILHEGSPNQRKEAMRVGVLRLAHVRVMTRSALFYTMCFVAECRF